MAPVQKVKDTDDGFIIFTTKSVNLAKKYFYTTAVKFGKQ
jgi:hypothetical protein